MFYMLNIIFLCFNVWIYRGENGLTLVLRSWRELYWTALEGRTVRVCTHTQACTYIFYMFTNTCIHPVKVTWAWSSLVAPHPTFAFTLPHIHDWILPSKITVFFCLPAINPTPLHIQYTHTVSKAHTHAPPCIQMSNTIFPSFNPPPIL